MLNNKKKNILINCASSKSGGAISYLKNLIPLLYREIERYNEYELFILTSEFQLSYLKNIKPNHLIIIKENIDSGLKRFIWELKNLKKYIYKYNIDILFTPYQVTPIFNNVENIVMIRNMEPFNFSKYNYQFKFYIRNKLLKILSNYTLKRADKIIAVSNYAKSYLINNLEIKNKKILTIYHGTPDIKKFKKSKNIQKNLPKKFIFTCGSILPYRRVEDIISSFNKVSGEIESNLSLIIAGSEIDNKYTKKIKKLIRQSKYKNKIFMLGNVSWNQIIYLYKKAFFCIFATEIEACPNIALEAMACGSNIISSNSEPLPEILKDSALYYPARDINKLSELILKNIKNKKYLNKKAIKISENFSWGKCAIETLNAIIK